MCDTYEKYRLIFWWRVTEIWKTQFNLTVWYSVRWRWTLYLRVKARVRLTAMLLSFLYVPLKAKYSCVHVWNWLTTPLLFSLFHVMLNVTYAVVFTMCFPKESISSQQCNYTRQCLYFTKQEDCFKHLKWAAIYFLHILPPYFACIKVSLTTEQIMFYTNIYIHII
jgi:hypothetical protein